MKNIVLITVDCLRYDYSKALIEGINEVIGQGIEFENVYNTGSSSLFSFLGFLCSKYPLCPDEKDSITQPYKEHKRTLLYDVLNKNGFKTYVLSNTSNLHRYFGFNKGIDELIDSKTSVEIRKQEVSLLLKEKSTLLFKVLQKFNRIIRKFTTLGKQSKEEGPPYCDAKEMTKIVKNLIEKHVSGKWFLHMHYMDPHGPPNILNEHLRNNLPKEEILRNKFGEKEIFRLQHILNNTKKGTKEYKEAEKELEIYRKIYHYEVLHVIENIKKVLNFLKNKGELKDSLVIVTSDHGEYLELEGGLLGHTVATKKKEHLVHLFYENVTHVPLIIWGAGQKKIKKLVSLIDLAPTILELVGIKKPSEWYGISMFSEEERPAISETIRFGSSCYSIKDKNWTFVYNEDTGQKHLYKRFPEDKKDLSKDNPVVVKKMYKLLEDHKKRKQECWKEYVRNDIRKAMEKTKSR